MDRALLRSVVLGLAVLALPSAHVLGETREAREQARLCERLDETEAVQACRSALELGLEPIRRAAVREILADHLVDLERWGELADHYREDVRLSPEDARAWASLGSTLLFALNERAEALASLEEAARLAPADAQVKSVLAIALHVTGRFAEASSAFDDAVRLDPTILEGRPAAQAMRAAARRGEPWP